MTDVKVIFRRPLPGGYFSIERSFAAIWPVLAGHQTTRVERVTACCVSKGFWPRLRILAQMAALRADVFHISGDIHFAAPALPGQKTILTVHDCGFLKHPNPITRRLLYFFWLKWPVRHCRFVTTVSEATKAEIVRHTGCDPGKITVIPSAIPEHFRPVPQVFFAEKPRILHIGSAPNKNLRRHIEALRGLPVVLHIVARLRDSEKYLLDQSGIEYCCTPNLDDAALVQAYKTCDMLLFASTLEGFGMPILEAQSVGRPVVTSNCSSMPEVAGAGACFVNPLDVASIRAGVLRVIRDTEFRETIVQRGFDNARRFQTEAVAAAYWLLYQKI
ncbi:MAG: glycosyltransferase family 4 protein [Lewinellaceae bacterium]|nr:glycosyltransferase family 4 protein [Lewinellaceae bacterium]